jgi:hypothetical protein
MSPVSRSVDSDSCPDIGRLFGYLILYTVGTTPCTRHEPVAGPLPTHTINAHRQTYMPRLGFEPTTPMFERAKTVYALDRVATVIGASHQN